MSTGKTVKLTKRTIDAIEATGRDFYVFDADLTGFGVRVRSTGAMSYFVQYRAGSGRLAPDRRITIAKVRQITPEQARERAKQLLADVVKGGDPAKERASEREAPTFAKVAEQFLEHVAAIRKPNTHAQYAHMLNAYGIPALGTMKAASVRPEDIAKLHRELKAKPTTANRVRDIISSMYGWAIKSKLLALPENPADGLAKFKEKKRERFLTSDELLRLGSAIREAETVGIEWQPDPRKKVKHAPKAANRRTKIDPAAAAALRLFLLTGARLREILHLEWSMVDLERGLLLLPDSKTGQKTIILNAPAQLILSEMPRIDRYVIHGRSKKVGKDGKAVSRPRADLKRPWALVRARAGLDASDEGAGLRVRLHDLRHTHASVGVGANMGLPVVGRLLGHSEMRTTERYSHLENDPLVRASNIIGKRIVEAMGEPQPTAEIIPMKRKGS